MSVNRTNRVSQNEKVVNLPPESERPSVESTALSTNESTTRKITTISKEDSETTKKTDSVVRSCLDKCSLLLNIFRKFKAYIIKRISLKWTEFTMRVFPNDLRLRANEAGIGKYSGERLVNAKWIVMGPGGKGTAVKGTAVDSVRQRIKEAHTENFTPVTDPMNPATDSQKSKIIEVPQQFAKDVVRSQYRYNGKTLFNPRDLKVSDEEKEIMKKEALFDISGDLVNRFGKDGFFNIAALLNQFGMAECISHLFYDIPNKPLNESKSYTVGNNQDLLSCYEIKEEKNEIHLYVSYLLQTLNGNNPEEVFGYLPVKREFIISKNDLETDWSKKTDRNITPKVIDTYKPFCQTQEIAQYYYDDLIK
jgi:hypothetical protein